MVARMARRSRSTVVGVISDTHGLLRPEASAVLAGSDLIVHAGDIGDPRVLAELAEIAPVHAVRGNNDRGPWAQAIDTSAAIDVDGRWLYVLHDLHELDLDPRAAGFAAVIAGHSHRPLIETRGGVLYVNPGSAGPRRFKLPIALARLRVDANGLCGEILEIAPRTSK